jgi:hypothetical protein
MKKQDLLKRAAEHIFSTGVGDSTSNLCRVNFSYGLAKMHYVQQKYGMEPNATFISTPDETITRNLIRWNQGIGYGGKITWGNGKEKLFMLDTKPNCCGMLVGLIDKAPDVDKLIDKLHLFEETKDIYINDIKVEWDFYKSNHFIDVFEVEETKTKKLGKYVVIIHAGAHEIKGDNPRGTGLYFNQSKGLQEIYKKINTPFGDAYILEGKDADEYYKFYQIADDFAKKRREVAFKNLFDGKVFCNKTHQGLINMNEIMLGCHYFENENELLPLSIRADSPSFIIKPKKNFTNEQIDSLGFKKRAEKHGVLNRLKKANIVPHGGGYQFPTALRVEKVHETRDKKRFFEIEMTDGIGKTVVSDPGQLPYLYRTRNVVERTYDIGLCEEQAVLMPLYTLKI